MSKKETAQERLERMRRESDGSPNFEDLAKKLEAIKEVEAKGKNEGHVKMTIYIRKDIADSFNALITKRGQQKEYANQALADFVQKKARELGI